MGDPFSIATGVAGLVSLGLTVCNGLHTYFSAIEDRKDDLAIVTQNLALFKFHIFVVQSSASQLGHRLSPAIDGLQLSLINCEMQLKCLEALFNEFRPTEDPSLAKEIWRKQKLIARYPLDRRKLVQLEEHLSRANTTLSSFIQALNLDINIRMSDELEAFRTSLEALDINTQTTLRTITTRLDDIGPKIEPSILQLLPSRIEEVTASSSNSVVLHQTTVGVAKMKTCVPRNERSSQDRTAAHSTPRYLQNAELEHKLCKKLAGMDCTCGASNGKTSNRPTSRKYRFWGGLTVSRQRDVRANHRPGCIFFQKSKRNVSRTSVTYFGLLSFFSQCFTGSLTQGYPGGPYSVSFGLQPCNIVKSSPALRLFAIGSPEYNKMFNSYKTRNCPDHLADSVIKELRAIYRSEKASPFDVDQNGNNVAHICLSAFQYDFKFKKALESSGIMIDAICKILSYLGDIGVPITASNFNQSNLLTLTINYGYLSIVPRLYNLVMIYDSNFYVAELAHNSLERLRPPWAFERQLNTLFEYPEICEDIGFSELFLAIITKDLPRLQSILAEKDSLLDISQTDLYGRNILNASSNWPGGLRILLQRQDVRPLMEMGPRPSIRFTPLAYALFYSKIYCNAPDQWAECDDCTCYVAVQLLLEADCKVTVSQGWAEILADCSLKARKLFFKHLKDRRQRLRNIALSILSEKILRQYGVATSSLPDKTATLLWKELQQAQNQQDHRVSLPDSLDPCNNSCVMPESFFDFPHHQQVIELAHNYGFAPRDENGVQTLLSGRLSTPQPLTGYLKVTVKYLDWLLQYDLNLELSLYSFRLSVLHRIASCSWNLSELQNSTILLPAICDNTSQCNIPCPCSSGTFTRPLAHILPAMLRHRGNSQFRSFFSHIGEQIELVVSCIDLLKISECSSEYLYMAKCAIHILTMMSLEVRHLPICLTENYDDLKDSMANEDWKEILDEDRELIDQLEALDREFGGVFDYQNVSIAEFLSGYWLTKMKEVLGDLNKPLSDDDRYNLLEAGVVLDKEGTCGSECRVECTE